MVRAKAMDQVHFYLNSFIKLILFALFVLLIASGCTKKEEVSTASFQIPSAQELRKAAYKGDVSAQAIETRIGRIMINVSGEGISPARVFIWDSKGQSTAPPASFTLEIPRGPGRLIQALVVLEEYDTAAEDDGGGGKNLFFYGDVVKDLSADVESVALTLASAGAATNGDGRITGRWMNADGTGPTGMVAMRFHPTNGRPPMVVSRTGIYGGWFEFFALQDIPFSYVMDNGLVLFNQVTTNSTALVASGDARSVKAYRPLGYYNRWDGTTTTSRGQAQPRRVIAGFFGPGSTGKKICYDTTPSTFDHLYLSQDITSATKMPWTGGAPTATGAGVELGGQGATGGACNITGDILFRDYLKLDHQKLAYGDGLFENRGPYMAFDAYGQGWKTQLKGQHDGTSLNLEWRYLPGVYNGVSGSAVFYRVLATAPTNTSGSNQRPDYELDDGIDCNNLTDPNRYSPAFIMASRVAAVLPTAATPVPAQTYSLANVIAQADFNAGKVQVVVCPYGPATDKYYTGGIDLRHSGGGGSTGSSNREIRFDLPLNAAESTCQTATARHYINGTETAVTAAETVNLSSWGDVGGSLTFYPTSAACAAGTPTASSVSFAQNQSTATFFYKTSAAGLYEVGGTVAQGYVRNARTAIYSAMTPMRASVIGQEYRLAAGYCYELGIAIKTSTGVLANNAAQTVVLTDTSYGSGGSFFTEETCTTSLGSTSVTFTANEAYRRIYFKPSTSATANVYSVSGAGLSMSSPYTYDLAPATLTRMEVRRYDVGPNVDASVLYNSNECVPVYAEPVAANGARLKLSSNTTMTIQNASGSSAFQFSSDNCTTLAANKTMNVSNTPSGSMTETFYIKVASNPALSSTLQMTLVSPALTSTQTWLREPTSIQILSDATANDFMGNFCHKVTIRALDSTAQPFVIPANASLNLNVYTTGGSFSAYSDSTCLTSDNSLFNGIQFASGSTTLREFYVSTTSPFSFGSSVHGSPTGKSGSFTVNSVLSFPTLANGIVGSGFSGNACVPVQTYLYDTGTSNAYQITAPVIVTYTMTGAAASNALGIYSDASCSNPAGGSRTFPAGTIYMTTYVLLAPTLATGTLSINAYLSQLNSGVSAPANLSCTAGMCN